MITLDSLGSIHYNQNLIFITHLLSFKILWKLKTLLVLKNCIEFTSKHFKSHLFTSSIHHQLSCLFNHAQNGRAEMKHRHMTEIGLVLFFRSHTSTRYWVDGFSTATYIINRLPTPLSGGKSPFELLYGSVPNYENFHPFSCRVYPCLHDYMPTKFSPCSIPCIFLCYSSSYKVFRCLDPTTSGIYITRHAQFDETHFPFLSTSLAQPIFSLEFSHFLEPYHTPTNTIKSSNMPHSQHITQSESISYGICTDLVNESILENDSVIVNMSLQENDSVTGPSLLHLTSISLEEPNPAPATATSISSHSMLTRAKMVFIKLVIQPTLLY